ncbi:Ribosome maturation factor RimP like [Melia azedarach]|uniref:Ribosome maturation factor RimP like n=1 Tax=Melia azedarach TaxID=155640 RepID=A0ACC1WPV5_MELAZ|nr:Ribosome maturation factor RimP like [Melia azedarach]
MDLVSSWNMRVTQFPAPTITNFSSLSLFKPSYSFHNLAFPFYNMIPNKYCAVQAKKRSSESKSVLKQDLVEDVLMEEDEEEEVLFEDFDDDELMDEDGNDFEDEYVEDDREIYVGDGGAGGGISLAGTSWDKEALAIAEDVCLSFDGDLKIYAFKTLSNSTIQVRIEKMSNKSGSPSMEDIEAFSTTYRAKLDEAEIAKSIPENISLEVSSPGVERVVQIPHELERFKERAMYVKYVNEMDAAGSTSESDGVFRLISADMETKCCTWGLADVRINREKAGKGRPLSKKQREWRLSTNFDSLHLVRLYSDC